MSVISKILSTVRCCWTEKCSKYLFYFKEIIRSLLNSNNRSDFRLIKIEVFNCGHFAGAVHRPPVTLSTRKRPSISVIIITLLVIFPLYYPKTTECITESFQGVNKSLVLVLVNYITRDTNYTFH